MITIKLTPEHLATQIDYHDFLHLAYELKEKLKKEYNLDEERFIEDIKGEFKYRPARDIIMGNSMIQNILIHYCDQSSVAMIGDKENIYTPEELRILRIAEFIEKDSITITESGMELIKQWEYEDAGIKFNHYKIKTYILDWFCDNV